MYKKGLQRSNLTSKETSLFKKKVWHILLVWTFWSTSVTQFLSYFFVTFTGCFPIPNIKMVHMRNPASFSLLKKIRIIRAIKLCKTFSQCVSQGSVKDCALIKKRHIFSSRETICYLILCLQEMEKSAKLDHLVLLTCSSHYTFVLQQFPWVGL